MNIPIIIAIIVASLIFVVLSVYVGFRIHYNRTMWRGPSKRAQARSMRKLIRHLKTNNDPIPVGVNISDELDIIAYRFARDSKGWAVRRPKKATRY